MLKLGLLPDGFGILLLGLQSGRRLSLNFVLLFGVLGRLWADLLRLLEDTRDLAHGNLSFKFAIGVFVILLAKSGF